MDRMEHFHGKLFEGDRVLLDDVDGYLGHHDRKNGLKTYFGYFEVATDRTEAIDGRNTYKLVFDDGRIGSIYTDIHASNRPGQSLAEFHVSGGLHR